MRAKTGPIDCRSDCPVEVLTSEAKSGGSS